MDGFFIFTVLANIFSFCNQSILLVRFYVCCHIKPHAPPPAWIPANSFKFKPCGCTLQAECLTR